MPKVRKIPSIEYGLYEAFKILKDIGIEEAIKKYRKKTAYRKPGNLMIENLKRNWNINIKRSIMVGDKFSDEKCAKKSGIKFFYPQNKFIKYIKNL